MNQSAEIIAANARHEGMDAGVAAARREAIDIVAWAAKRGATALEALQELEALTREPKAEYWQPRAGASAPSRAGAADLAERTAAAMGLMGDEESSHVFIQRTGAR